MPEITATYSVPSAHKPGDYYTVHLIANGATQCDCTWGSKENAPTRCWHVRAAQAIEFADDLVPFHAITTETIERARRGSIHAQVRVFEHFIAYLAGRSEFSAASRAAEVLQKYLLAVSLQGAAASSLSRVEIPDQVAA